MVDIPPDDGLKWFGEGFDGFPKRLPDDTVEYVLYILDSLPAEARVRARFNQVLKASKELTKSLVKDYIWQRDAFALGLERDADRWVLRGRATYADSVADEWLIVYLLREISKQFPDVWLRVYDNDGEFLLIEAANALPKWLSPEVAENRVWINQGQLRIIPLAPSDSRSKALDLNQALERIRAEPASLLRSSLVEEEAFYRLRRYPQAIRDNLHSSLLTVPRKLAYVLHANPAYTSPAVESFYLRDPISLRPLQKPSPTDLIFPPQDFVTMSIRFNKASYAQLRSQEFPMPKAWENAPFVASKDPEDVTRRELGLKLTCGFEMLMRDPLNKNKTSVREIQLLLEDVEAGEDSLPTDSQLSAWPQTEDSDSWMDINFENLQAELDGKGATSGTSSGAEPHEKMWGDRDAQENLRRMLSNFESFMNDDSAGPEGAESANTDSEDGYSSQSGSDEEEDDAVSFDENEFKRLMREMMGMPDADTEDLVQAAGQGDKGDSEDEEIMQLSKQMEKELNASGALDLEPTLGKMKSVASDVEQKGDSRIDVDDDASEGSVDAGDVQIDYNLARNLLEAFKGQAGVAGPVSNMVGMMGIQLPRDEKTESVD